MDGFGSWTAEERRRRIKETHTEEEMVVGEGNRRRNRSTDKGIETVGGTWLRGDEQSAAEGEEEGTVVAFVGVEEEEEEEMEEERETRGEEGRSERTRVWAHSFAVLGVLEAAWSRVQLLG